MNYLLFKIDSINGTDHLEPMGPITITWNQEPITWNRWDRSPSPGTDGTDHHHLEPMGPITWNQKKLFG